MQSRKIHTDTGRDRYISAMGAAVNGVNVITTDGPAGKLGLTVSAVSSVSADPPLLLACINRSSPICGAISTNGVFCVNLLSIGQRSVAQTFSGQPASGRPYDFGCASWSTGITGAPALIGAVSEFDCVLEHWHDAGSHTIFLGAVVGARTSDKEPLLYSRRTYGKLVRTEDLASAGNPSPLSNHGPL